MSFSIVIPCYNSEKSISTVVNNVIKETVGLEGFDLKEIICVNDFSEDNTQTVIQELNKQNEFVNLVSNQSNLGQVRSTIEGIKVASGDYIVTLDDDGQHPPSEIFKLLKKCAKGNFDFVSGYWKNDETRIRNISSIIANFLLNSRKKRGILNKNDYIASTIVSSPIMEKVARNFGIECVWTLTGFKWISKEIEIRKNQNFIFGGEESFGYLVGSKIRDKDAVTPALVICEIASILKNKEKTLYDYMIECYKLFNPHKERLLSYKIEGVNGEKEIKNMMFNFRNDPPKKINGQKVITIDDYLNSTSKSLINSQINKLNLPKSDVISYRLIDNTKISIRPSGTEPKIKFYFSVSLDKLINNDWELTENQLDNRINSIIKDLDL